MSSDEARRAVDKGDPRRVLPAPDPDGQIPIGEVPAAADPPPATAKPIAAETAQAERPIPKAGDPQRATTLRVASAVAALLAVGAFFFPAVRDAFFREAEPPTVSAPPRDRSLSLSVQSHPVRASVTVDGVDRGHTPALLSVSCEPGVDVVVEVSAAGRQTYRTTLPCAPGGTSSVAATLQPAR